MSAVSLWIVFNSVTINSVDVDGIGKFVFINRKSVACNGTYEIDIEEIKSIVVNIEFFVKIFQGLAYDFVVIKSRTFIGHQIFSFLLCG